MGPIITGAYPKINETAFIDVCSFAPHIYKSEFLEFSDRHKMFYCGAG